MAGVSGIVGVSDGTDARDVASFSGHFPEVSPRFAHIDVQPNPKAIRIRGNVPTAVAL